MSDESQWSEVGKVLLFGGAGGLLSWVYAQTVGQPYAGSPWVVIPSSFLLGMGAAYIGVYLLANSDRKDLLRCLGFALACGFAWKPVYEAGSALITQQQNQKLESKAAALTQQVAEVNKALLQAPPDQTDAKVAQAATTAVQALNAAQNVRDPAIQREAYRKATEFQAVVDQLRKAPPHGPNPLFTADTESRLKAFETHKLAFELGGPAGKAQS